MSGKNSGLLRKDELICSHKSHLICSIGSVTHSELLVIEVFVSVHLAVFAKIGSRFGLRIGQSCR